MFKEIHDSWLKTVIDLSRLLGSNSWFYYWKLCYFSLANLMETPLRHTQSPIQFQPGRVPPGTMLPERETGHLPLSNTNDQYTCWFASTRLSLS